MSINKTFPKPISLNLLEKSYYSLKRDEPEKFSDREVGEGFAERIHVRYTTKQGEVRRENLSTVADPNWDPEGSGWGFHDGYLSYQEAKGKTFLIPNYFCNPSGATEIEVKKFSDFKHLRDALTRPIFNENHRIWRCIPGERISSTNPSSSSKDSTPKGGDSEIETMSMLESGINYYLGDLKGEDLKGFQEHFQEALGQIGSLSSFGAIPSFAVGVGIGKALNDYMDNGQIDWEGFEEAINTAQAQEALEGEDGPMCTEGEDVCDGDGEDWDQWDGADDSDDLDSEDGEMSYSQDN